MSTVKSDVVKGALKVSGAVDRQCFKSLQDFLTALPSLLSVEVPKNLSGVIYSTSSPSAVDDRDKLWVRTDVAGGIVGLYAFQGGEWHPLYSVIPGEVFWISGSSANVPDGFVLITAGDAVIPSDVVDVLTSRYVPPGPGPYQYYAVRFIGF